MGALNGRLTWRFPHSFQRLVSPLDSLPAIGQYGSMRAVLVLLGALPALAQFAYVQLEPQVIVPGTTQCL